MTSVSSAKETLRLAKLQDYKILDSPPEPAYDDIAKLAAHICQAPIALVSLIDAKRQWFKSSVGLDVRETPRNVAFCEHTIQRKRLMIVEDTYLDPIFRSNPLVTGAPHIRFYAGAPLISPDGHALGSLCVIDRQPRRLNAEQTQALERLSRQVISQMELSRHAHQLHSSHKTLEERVQERTSKLTSALHRLLEAQSQLVKREAALRHSSLHDPLTGLPNRSYFLQRLSQAIQLNSRQPTHLYAVLFIDLDNFKPVNDALGHEVGDLLLQHVAKQIKQLMRSSDLVARLGGDEFAILLDNIPDEDHAIVAVERLQEKLEAPFVFGDRKVFVGASIGVTYSTAGYREPEAALRDADTAMYSAKERTRHQTKEQLKVQRQRSSGKSPVLFQEEVPVAGQRFAVFDAAMQGRAAARITLEDELRQALIQDQFQLYYQPIFNLETRSLSSFEVLLRWDHPTRGRLSANDFIEVADEIGIVRQLCAQVIQTVCQQLTKWRSHPDYKTLSLHINLSLLQLRCPQLVSLWQTAFESYQVPATAFQLELDESIFLTSDPSITTTLQQLKAEGFSLCVDNFGRGHTSLSRLHQLEVSTLKIDRAFIEELESPDSQDIIKTIVDLGLSTSTTVIAEGIETEQQLDQIIRLGCRFCQGFWLSKALSSDEIDLALLP